MRTKGKRRTSPQHFRSSTVSLVRKSTKWPRTISTIPRSLFANYWLQLAHRPLFVPLWRAAVVATTAIYGRQIKFSIKKSVVKKDWLSLTNQPRNHVANDKGNSTKEIHRSAHVHVYECVSPIPRSISPMIPISKLYPIMHARCSIFHGDTSRC